jgi:hypothetical protein
MLKNSTSSEGVPTMVPRITSLVVIVVAVLGMGIYWLVTRPTPEETSLKNFFQEFRQGHYVEAEDITVGKDFYKMAAQTKVRDTDGKKYLIGDYFPESRKTLLQISVENYVKMHIVKWKYLRLDTQKLGENESAVAFRIELGIKDYTGGDVFGDVREGRIEGTAYMKKEDDSWKVEKFDFALFSDNGLTLSPYLSQAGTVGY